MRFVVPVYLYLNVGSEGLDPALRVDTRNSGEMIMGWVGCQSWGRGEVHAQGIRWPERIVVALLSHLSIPK